MAAAPDLSGVALTQSTILFMTLLPNVSDMRKASPNDVEFREDVRTSEGVAIAVSLATGIGASAISKSMTPLYVALISTALLVVLSELLLRHNSQEGESA